MVKAGMKLVSMKCGESDLLYRSASQEGLYSMDLVHASAAAF
jgi:hypothetical protein